MNHNAVVVFYLVGVRGGHVRAIVRDDKGRLAAGAGNARACCRKLRRGGQADTGGQIYCCCQRAVVEAGEGIGVGCAADMDGDALSSFQLEGGSLDNGLAFIHDLVGIFLRHV